MSQALSYSGVGYRSPMESDEKLAMRLNVYIPRDKEHLLTALAEEAERTGRSKNEVVLEAIEQRVAPAYGPRYRTFPFAAGPLKRADLYDERLTLP